MINYMDLIIRADVLLFKHGKLIDYIYWNIDDKFISKLSKYHYIAGDAAITYLPPNFDTAKPTVNLLYSGNGIRIIRSDETRFITNDEEIYTKKMILGLAPWYDIWDY